MHTLILAILAGCGRGAVSDSGGGQSGPTGPWPDLALALKYGCALDADGQAACSGTVNNSSPRGYEPTTPLTDITTTFLTACGFGLDGETVCFGPGDTDSAATLVHPPDDAFTTLAGGPEQLCGVRESDGRPICWGDDWAGMVTSVPDVAVSAVSIADVGMCALTVPDGEVVCWGNAATELVAHPPAGSFVKLDLGGEVGVAIDERGELIPWGDDWAGVADVPSGNFVQVAVGAWSQGLHLALDEAVASRHACAIDTEGELRCWGDDRFGATTAPELGPGWTDIDCNALASCGIHSGEIHCWGTQWPGAELPPE